MVCVLAARCPAVSIPYFPLKHLSHLIRIIPPPDEPNETGSLKGWNRVQEHLGQVLPMDYKDFIDCYGSGHFSNGIQPFNPFTRNETRNLFQALDTHYQASCQVEKMAKTKWSIVDPFRLYPAPGGLLPWGTMPDYVVTFFWHMEGDPDSWATIVYNLLQGEYEVWKFTFVHFLYKLVSGEHPSLLLPAITTLKNGQVQFIPS